MSKNHLYLEERIAVVYRALNVGSLSFQDKMDKEERIRFKQFVCDMMGILTGFNEPDMIARLDKICASTQEKSGT